MKRFLKLIIIIAMLWALTLDAHAQMSDRPVISLYNEDASSFLSENGVDLSEPETITNVDAGSFLKHFYELFKNSIHRPAKILITVMAFSLISRFVSSAVMLSKINDVVFVILCFLAISPEIILTLNNTLSALSSIQAFMASYVPILAAIAAASGNIGAATSYSALVLYVSEGAVLIGTLVLKPTLVCMLVLSCVQAINEDMPDMTGALRRLIVGVVGFVMTVFSAIIGIQSAIGQSGSAVALRAGKYLVSSFVPIIGAYLSESYNTVKLSLSAMRSGVGAIGIVIIVIILSAPIVSMYCYKLFLCLSDWVCGIMGSKRIGKLVKGLSDVYSLSVTVLMIYALMFIISTGIVILLGNGMGI